MKSVVLIHSKPGLGKSTLAKSVAAQLSANGLNARQFSIGSRLYGVTAGEIKSVYYELAQKYKDTLAQNGVIDDPALIHGIFKEALIELKADVTIIDGHPMFMRLLKGFEQQIAEGELRLVAFIVLDGTDTLASERMRARDRTLFGVGDDPAARLALYKAERQRVADELEKRYGALHIDASLELEQKTTEACNHILSLL